MPARDVAYIQQLIIEDVQAQPELVEANSTSRRSIWRLWTFIVASATGILEQLIDCFKYEVETIADKAPVGIGAWIQDKVFSFQYDSTNTQLLQMINLKPQYPIVNTSLRIVTRCSVTSNISNFVKIKVAKKDGALTSDELSALQYYVDIFGIAGITYLVSSKKSDKLFVDATIYFAGQYSPIIKSNIATAIENFLASIPFDGNMKVSDLEKAIRNVEGVNDVILNNVKVRQDLDLFQNGTFLVQNNFQNSRYWPTIAGYIDLETTIGQTLQDSLKFIAE